MGKWHSRCAKYSDSRGQLSRSATGSMKLRTRCRCGTELETLFLKQSKAGRGRFSAECTNCGRLFRKSGGDHDIVRVMSSAESVARLSTSSPTFLPVRDTARDFINIYRVKGMPDGSTANLIRIPSWDRWTFVIHTQQRSIHGEWFSKTTGDALEDLRDWLRAHDSSESADHRN